MQEQTVLELANVRKTYPGNVQALNGVSVSVQRGEFIVVIGPSGAGKSTLIRCINRLVDPTSGTILFDGERIDNSRGRRIRAIRSRMGMIFQHYNLVDRANVLKNILYGRLGHMNLFQSLLNRYPQDIRQKAVELLEQVGLIDQMYQRADHLSGGQKQRVGICRALMQEPDILLADEPIASLDPGSATTVMDILQRVCEERGMTLIVNLHQVDFAMRYATRIIALKKGLVVYDGAPEQLSQDIIADIYKGKESEMYLEKTGTAPELQDVSRVI